MNVKTKEAGKVRYEVFGPFPFRTSGDANHRQSLREFWSDRKKDGSPEDLSKAVGVYVLTFREGDKWVPWNVGLTNKGFGKRFVQKEKDFLLMLRGQPDAEVQVYLLALRSKTGRFRKPTVSPKIEVNNWLETMLIGASINVNPNLRNEAKVKYLRTTVVDGYLNDKIDKRNEAAQSFSALFKA